MVVAAAHGQHVAGDREGDGPDDVVEGVELLGRPRGGAGAVGAGPQDHATVL